MVLLAVVQLVVDVMGAHVDIMRIRTTGIGSRADIRSCRCPQAAAMQVAVRPLIRGGAAMGVAPGPAAAAGRRPAVAAEQPEEDLGMELIKWEWVPLVVV